MVLSCCSNACTEGVVMSRRGVNVAIVLGNVGTDPEVRYTPSGSAVANVSLATSESWKDKQSGEMQERTEWHRVVFYNKLVEIVGEYVTKGSKLYINGSIRTRKWQDQAGVERYTTEIIANDMQMLDRKGEVDPMAAPSMPKKKQVTSEQPTDNFADGDDDIPF